MTHKSKLLGACGLYCGACAIFLAKDHPQLAVALAERFRCTPDEITCDGCQGRLEERWCAPTCQYWLKAEQVGEYRVCRPEDAYDGADQEAANLIRIRDVGPDRWLEEQRVLHICPDCGGQVTSGGKCLSCGRQGKPSRT